MRAGTMNYPRKNIISSMNRLDSLLRTIEEKRARMKPDRRSKSPILNALYRKADRELLNFLSHQSDVERLTGKV